MSKKLKNAPQTISVTFGDVEDQQRKAAVALMQKFKVSADLTVTKPGDRNGDERK